jgi:hypothetical protein
MEACGRPLVSISLSDTLKGVLQSTNGSSTVQEQVSSIPLKKNQSILPSDSTLYESKLSLVYHQQSEK